jgi:hypothetical protein
VTSSLIDERDSARQALEQEQNQTERLRKLLAEAQQQGANPQKHSNTPSRAALPAPAETAATSEAVVVVLTYDLPSLAIDMRALTEKLARLRQAAPDAFSGSERTQLAEALDELSEAVEAILDKFFDG